MTIIIDGNKTAQIVKDRATLMVDAIKSQTGVTPGLAVVLVGEDPAVD